MRLIIRAILLISLLCFLSCNKWVIKSDPRFQSIDNNLYSIIITPSRDNGWSYTAFELSITNKTDNDIEIIWDKTYFLNHGRTSGGFMFEGILYRDRNNPKPPDIVFPKTNLSKTIYPNNLVQFYRDWYHSAMPNGKNGIYLMLLVNNKEVRERLELKISADYAKH